MISLEIRKQKQPQTFDRGESRNKGHFCIYDVGTFFVPYCFQLTALFSLLYKMLGTARRVSQEQIGFVIKNQPESFGQPRYRLLISKVRAAPGILKARKFGAFFRSLHGDCTRLFCENQFRLSVPVALNLREATSIPFV